MHIYVKNAATYKDTKQFSMVKLLWCVYYEITQFVIFSSFCVALAVYLWGERLFMFTMMIKAVLSDRIILFAKEKEKETNAIIVQ